MRQAESWSRSNSCWVTFRWKRRNATSGVSSGCGKRSTTRSDWNPEHAGTGGKRRWRVLSGNATFRPLAVRARFNHDLLRSGQMKSVDVRPSWQYLGTPAEIEGLMQLFGFGACQK